MAAEPAGPIVCDGRWAHYAAGVLHEERKYDVGPLFVLPDLRAEIPEGATFVEHAPVTLRTTYHDTPDLRLARNGVSLRYRRGGSGPPWSLRLPTGEPNLHRRITARGLASRVPDDIGRLVLGYTRGVALSPVAALSTVRRRYQVLDVAGASLIDLIDDRVSVLEGRRVVSRFRELGLRSGPDDRKLLDRVEMPLLAAGADADHTLQQVRALGPLAAEPPDLPAAQPLGPDPCAADMVIEELRREVGRLLTYDLEVRLTPDDREALDQLRIACRRLRTVLSVFSPLFTPEPTPSRFRTGTELLEPLRDLASGLRAVIAPDEMRARLAGIEARDVIPTDLSAVARLDEAMARMAGQAATTLATSMAGSGYTRLLDGLITTARAPRLSEEAHAAAVEVLPGLAVACWERLIHAVDNLSSLGPPDEWRSARRAARSLRRLCRLAVPVVGEPAQRLINALDPVIGLLDVEREAHHAAEVWLAASASASTDRMLAVTVGRLVDREQVLVCAARDAFGAAWETQPWGQVTEWLV